MKPTVILHNAADRKWLRFCNPHEIVQTAEIDEVVDCLRRVESLVDRWRWHAAGFVSYEAAPAFDRALKVRESGDFPLIWFGLYESPEEIDLPRAAGSVGPTPWSANVLPEEYAAIIAELKRCIADGETYQVNYSFRLRQAMAVDPWQFFLEMCEAQQAEYAAFLDTPEFAIGSASPELFFRLSGEEIVCRPMKGTTGRGRYFAEDEARAAWLAASEKNRAENAMIVDMMRNDLGRIARIGSVQVGDVFRVERYPTLWQMTSRVEARTDASLAEIFSAMFPCASVTGAPKPRTMQIIARLETTPRRVYTGSIGWIAPGRRAQFNVAIRTVIVDKAASAAEYGVGGGVVWDSTPTGEYQECLLKARILTERRPEFSLLETLVWTPDEGFFVLEEHLRRLSDSAVYFGFPPPREAVRRRLDALAAGLPATRHRVRVVVDRRGEVACEATPFEPPASDQPVRLVLASRPVDSRDVLLYHKTTHRAVYDAARVDAGDTDDVLLYNQRGEITETTIANVVLRLGNALWTPPVESGLLAGAFRAKLLAEGKIAQRVVDLDMLDRCEELWLINSVRKWRKATLLDHGAGRSTCEALQAEAP